MENAVAASIFNSPVLKPRVPQPTQHEFPEPNQEAHKKSKSKPNEESNIQKDREVKDKSRKKRKSPSGVHEKSTTKQTTLDPYVKRGRKRVASSDSEREARKLKEKLSSRLLLTIVLRIS